ncbi:MAG: cob(I)yrinic acid a,c-diamide adenosyltransferase [Candidatus Altiarchaeota archaeon]|nr:cob(I)yrinic acid a,c-diamide adenosyltransferase [Candidatus Altiarchaeota archaeon]
MKGNTIIYTGEGGGKTTAALGLSLRAAGHGKKVVVVQFMKGRKDTGEYMIRERLAPEYEIRQFGREEFVDFDDPSTVDKELTAEGLRFVKESLAGKPDMLVLDEINLAAAIGLVDVRSVLELLRLIPPETIVVLTGRYAPEELVDAADYVVEVKDLKRPEKELPARAGFEY